MSDEILQYVWPDLLKAFSSLHVDSAGWSLLPVGLRAPMKMNRVRISEDSVIRISDGSNSEERPIPKEQFLEFARMAIEAPCGRFCIKGTRTPKAGWCGAFVSTSLARLSYFEYKEGQFLLFSKDQFKKARKSAAKHPGK